MRVVLDTNLFLSALLSAKGPPARIVEAWRTERFDLVTSLDQIEEVKRAAGYDKVQCLAAEADYLVTGDRALLSLGHFAATQIVTPRRFASLLVR